MKKFYLALLFASAIYQDCYAVNAGNPDVSWYNSYSKSFVLSTKEEILGLAKLTNEGNSFEGKKIYMTENVSFDGLSWTPIGTSDNPFKGTFDGGLHKVILCDIVKSEYGGFFGYVLNADIKNLSVSCSKSINNCQNFGAIVGSSDAKTTISYCSHIDSLIIDKANSVGGISASSNAYITGCRNEGVIISRQQVQSFVGGIVGIGAPTVENSYNLCSVSGAVVVGGLIGKLSNVDNILISNSVNYGEVYVDNHSNSTYQYSIGGLIGIAPFVFLTSCWNEGKISISSYKEGDKISVINAYAGGLIGEGAGKIKYCYNTGEVFVRNVVNSGSNAAKVNNVVAGIIGMNTEKGITEISFSYNSGKILSFGQAPIKVSHNYGGIVGNFVSFMPKLTGVYSLDGCCNALESNGSTVTTTFANAEMQVSNDQMSSSEFLMPVKNTVNLNNDMVYLYDINGKNNHFPVLKNVLTSTPHMKDDGNVVLEGVTNVSGKCYFKYWITGMEQYSVDIDVLNDNFTYDIGRISQGEHNVKAYVLLPDNTKIEGEKITFTYLNKGELNLEPLQSTENAGNFTQSDDSSVKKYSSTKKNRHRYNIKRSRF